MADGPHGFDGKLRCSFCGKTQNEVDKLIAGEGVYICNECVRLCTDIIDEEDDATQGEGCQLRLVAPKASSRSRPYRRPSRFMPSCPSTSSARRMPRRRSPSPSTITTSALPWA